MEEVNEDKEQQIADAFNNGYIIAMCLPEVFEDTLFEISPDEESVRNAFIAGHKQYEHEKYIDYQTNELNRLREGRGEDIHFDIDLM